MERICLTSPWQRGAYTERRGGYEHMLGRHHDLAITGQQRLAFVTLLSRAADEAGLPSDPEFRAAIMGYAEWGTRLAVQNPQPGAETLAHAPVPRWGWGVAAPYEPDRDAESWTPRFGSPRYSPPSKSVTRLARTPGKSGGSDAATSSQVSTDTGCRRGKDPGLALRGRTGRLPECRSRRSRRVPAHVEAFGTDCIVPH
jgi:hypothetical protein